MFPSISSRCFALPRHFPDFIRANGTIGILFVSHCAAYYLMEILLKIQHHLFLYAKSNSVSTIKVISAYCVWRLLVPNSQWLVHANVFLSHEVPKPLFIPLPLVTMVPLTRQHKGAFLMYSKLTFQGPCAEMKCCLIPQQMKNTVSRTCSSFKITVNSVKQHRFDRNRTKYCFRCLKGPRAHLAAEHASASYSRQYYFSLSLIIKYKYRSHK